MKPYSLLIFLFLLLFMASCGIHFNVHNPRHAGTYPEFTRERILLGSNSKWRSCFDVHHYDLDIVFDMEKKQLSGWVGIAGTMTGASDSIQIDLAQNLYIDRICWSERDGALLKYTRDRRAVITSLPRTLKRGEAFKIYVRYHGQPVQAKKAPWMGGLVWKKDKQGNAWAGVACETDGASIWFPCKDVTNDEPDSADLKFSLPGSDLMVVSNGVFRGKTTNNGFNTFHWSVHNPINTYNITFYIGNFARIDDTCISEHGRLDITHYVLKPNVERATHHFKAAKEHIRFYESIYGPYAWYTDGFKLVEAPYAGMEHQTAIAYGNGYRNSLMGKEDYIMLHEIGHEWFGNAVTAADLADVWIQEGITTYGEALFMEHKYGKAVGDQYMQWYKWRIKNKRPLVGPLERRFFDYKDGDVYVKGAWMLHSLRTTINNDSLFFAGLRTFYQRYSKSLVSSKDFINVINEVTGRDYNWFFKQYLYDNKVPFLEYSQERGVLYYRWNYVQDDFRDMPVTLTTTEGKRFIVYPSSELQKSTIGINGQNVEFTFDRNGTLYGLTRILNWQSALKRR